MPGWRCGSSSNLASPCAILKGRASVLPFFMSLRQLSLAFLLAIALPLAAAGQRAPRLPERYDKWLNEEATYIISDAERKEFLQLKTDGDRDKFIEEFWEIRNPLRGAKQ